MSIADSQWGRAVLVARNHLPNNLVRLVPDNANVAEKSNYTSLGEGWRGPLGPAELATSASDGCAANSACEPRLELRLTPAAEEIDPLYLFACQVEWEQRSDPSAGWEVISAGRSAHQDTRAHARALLERMQQIRAPLPEELGYETNSAKETGMRTPYGLDVIESCMGCKVSREGFFCRFSPTVLRSMDGSSYHSVMPSGAILFVEGQSPRGIYVVCSGKVKLSTTSKDGKVLILKQAEAGEVLGLSAAISGTSYEMTAETSTPCQLNFIGRQDLMTLLQRESEMGVHVGLSLSREFQGAYRDIHDLVLARSSSGKLARLLLSCVPAGDEEAEEPRVRGVMTHEEMAQRIGSSRETVTRLLSNLKKKRLIRLEGTTLVIRDRTGLESLAV
ncbi:MAG: Crp/Fnr family transcriptional regulator [Candidatus Sulfotelmatobacter sp.]